MRGASSGYVARFLHVLPLVIERDQRVAVLCIGLYVRVSRTQGATPLENLFISDFPRSFSKHSNPVTLLCAATTHGCSVPSERDARSLASSLHCSYRSFRFGGYASAGAEH